MRTRRWSASFSLVLPPLAALAGAPEPAPPSAPANAPAYAPASVPPEAAACVRAAASAPFVPLPDRFAHVSRACASLFHEPKCRAAWTGAAAQPAHRRAAHLIEACRAAYCPRLRPKPSLCAGELSPARMLAESAPLVQAALALDHGPAFADWMAGMVRPPPNAPPSAPPSAPPGAVAPRVE